MARALVTGGSGFVGRHICTRLIAEGYDVVCVDPLMEGTGAIHPRAWPFPLKAKSGQFTFIEEDCRTFFKSHVDHFDLVFHLAALVGGRISLETQTLLVAEDLAVDAEMWKWATLAKPGCVLYFSSSAAYPVHLQTREHHVLLSEDMINFETQMGVPDLSYGWAKLTGEYLMKLYVEKYGGRAVAYRPFSGYGEDQHLNYPFPAICKRLLEEKGKPDVFVWGTGQQVRDFIHIDDCVDLIWQTHATMPSGMSLNLSTGIPTPFIELARIVAEEVGWEPNVAGLSDKPEGVFFRCGDTTLQQSLGLTPKITLREGVRRVLAHVGMMETVA